MKNNSLDPERIIAALGTRVGNVDQREAFAQRICRQLNQESKSWPVAYPSTDDRGDFKAALLALETAAKTYKKAAEELKKKAQTVQKIANRQPFSKALLNVYERYIHKEFGTPASIEAIITLCSFASASLNHERFINPQRGLDIRVSKYVCREIALAYLDVFKKKPTYTSLDHKTKTAFMRVLDEVAQTFEMKRFGRSLIEGVIKEIDEPTVAQAFFRPSMTKLKDKKT